MMEAMRIENFESIINQIAHSQARRLQAGRAAAQTDWNNTYLNVHDPENDRAFGGINRLRLAAAAREFKDPRWLTMEGTPEDARRAIRQRTAIQPVYELDESTGRFRWTWYANGSDTQEEPYDGPVDVRRGTVDVTGSDPLERGENLHDRLHDTLVNPTGEDPLDEWMVETAGALLGTAADARVDQYHQKRHESDLKKAARQFQQNPDCIVPLTRAVEKTAQRLRNDPNDGLTPEL